MSFVCRGTHRSGCDPFTSPDSKELLLTEVFPFLDVFLPEAREYWANPAGKPSVRSEFWTQKDAHTERTTIFLRLRWRGMVPIC